MLEKAKATKLGQVVEKGAKVFDAFSSPIKTFMSENKIISKTSKFLGKGAKFLGPATKFLGKVSTVTTYAELITTGVSASITEGIKEKSIGKGVIGGLVETAKSIGPLEGMTIGMTTGGFVGGAVGFLGGLANKGLQKVFPNMYDNLKTWGYDLWDNVTGGKKEKNRNTTPHFSGSGAF